MRLDEYSGYDATGLAGLVAAREVSPRELAAAALHAADLANPGLNAIVERWDGDVDANVRALPAQGPFRGVPIFFKESIQVRGKRSENGSRLAAGVVARADSPHMQRIRAAGFVPLGTTTMPEFGYSFTTESALHGITRNPWNPAFSAGGSSGGAAAVAAAGIVPLCHATDGGGSIRVPASYCGLVGLKPTRARIPLGPQGRESNFGFSVEGALTRSVRDMAAYLDAVHGPHPGQPYFVPAPARSFAEAASRPRERLRIGVVAEAWGGERTDPRVAAVLARVARACDALGHAVDAVEFDPGVGWEECLLTLSRSGGSAMARLLPAVAAATGREVDERTVERPCRLLAEFGRGLRANDLIDAMDAQHRLTRSMHLLFERIDVLLTPTMPGLPVRIGYYAEDLESLDLDGWAQRLFGTSPFTPLYSMSGLPALSLPLGHADDAGLPIGIQLGAGFAREDLLLSLAAQLEQAMPWTGRRPPAWGGAA